MSVDFRKPNKNNNKRDITKTDRRASVWSAVENRTNKKVPSLCAGCCVFPLSATGNILLGLSVSLHLVFGNLCARNASLTG